MSFSALLKTTTLSEICRDVAQVFFASMFVDLVLNGKTILFTSFSGLILSTGFWITGLLLAKE